MTQLVPQQIKSSPTLLGIALSGSPETTELPLAQGYIQSLVSSTGSESGSQFKDTIQKILTGPSSTRGRILKEKRTAQLTLVSGLAQWSHDQGFLVPDDAFDLNDPTQLVSLEDWPGVLALDLWVEGDLEGFTQWLQAKGPSKVIACLHGSPEEYLKSSVPGKNLFTQLWGLAYSGEPEALDGQHLTLSSLASYLKTSGLPIFSQGEEVLADFTPGMFHSLGFSQFPVQSLGIRAQRICGVKEVLSEIKHWSRYSESQLEYSVNHNLAPYLVSELGETAVTLRQTLGLQPQEIDADELEINFGSGRITYQFEITHKKAGQLITLLWFDPFWFSRPDQINLVMEALPHQWDALIFLLSHPIEPKAMIPSLQAKGWELQQETEGLVIAQKAQLEVKLEPEVLEIIGSRLSELFNTASQNDSLKEILALLGTT